MLSNLWAVLKYFFIEIISFFERCATSTPDNHFWKQSLAKSFPWKQCLHEMPRWLPRPPYPTLFTKFSVFFIPLVRGPLKFNSLRILAFFLTMVSLRTINQEGWPGVAYRLDWGPWGWDPPAWQCQCACARRQRLCHSSCLSCHDWWQIEDCFPHCCSQRIIYNGV